MIKKLKTLLLSSIALISILVPAVAVPVTVHAATADIDKSLCQGANLKAEKNATTTCASTGDAVDTVNNVIAKVINIFSFVVGVVAVIMIIIGGIRFVISGGDSNNVTAARNTILYAIVGLVIVALAQIIVRFVINKATTVG